MASKFKHPGLESTGYYFNDKFELRQLGTDEPFKWQDQQHYDVVGDQVIEWIQDYMVTHYGMKEIWLGGDSPATGEGEGNHSNNHGSKGSGKGNVVWDKPSRSGVFTVDEADESRVTAKEMKRLAKTNIFVSSDFYTASKLLVIIQGSGFVRPGQWARALCINHSLKSGTIFDYLDIARELGMATIVLNPNLNQVKLRIITKESPHGTYSKTHDYPVLDHEDHIKHTLYVWDHFVTKSAVKDIWMVAHSRGGDSAIALLNHRLVKSDADAEYLASLESKGNAKVSTITPADEANMSFLHRKLRALAFTDSVHWIGGANSKAVKEWVMANSRDWVASSAPLDQPESSHNTNTGCECFSSGHSKHEWTSACAVNSVFKFLVEMAEPGSLPRWTERQIDFSTPPQIPGGSKTDGANHVRTGSYADVASGRSTTKAQAESAALGTSSNTSQNKTHSPQDAPAPFISQNTAFFVGLAVSAVGLAVGLTLFLRRRNTN